MSLILICLATVCLDHPIDNRSLKSQWRDVMHQIKKPTKPKYACYVNGHFYKDCPSRDYDDGWDPQGQW